MNADDDETVASAAARCVRCGGSTVAIVYGFPDADLVDAAERGEVELGGCVVFDERPKRRCRNCGAGLPGEDTFTRREPCEVHEMANCAVCHPPPRGYLRGRPVENVPPGHYVEVRGGKGVYHHPDCFNVTGEWDGAAMATLGERLVRSPQDIRASGLRAAGCCEPPQIR